ncbi:MAG: phosphoribosylaminoimidazolesuccinocarboxamide synthase [Ignavibacteriaceae bacterium]|nr:phosphoribosylaminoimidazolesuccinocarboxamide synthase [Ignavibacteriaceae bacterium]
MLKKETPGNNHPCQMVEYHDSFTDLNNNKIKSKNMGEKFAFINSFFLDYLKEYHIPSSFLKLENKNQLIYQKHDRYPFSIRILNIIDKRTASIFKKHEFDFLVLPVFEFHYGIGKDTLITENHLITFDLCSIEDIKTINRICSKINAVLKSFFERRNLHLAEVTCHFAKIDDRLFIVDDFTPASLKIIPLNKEAQYIDPYKFGTSSDIKRYTDHLFNLLSS